uniref:Uncharacterized protein n=1 Tax=Trichogramma kaykai TaxID=54128 RepID=A0ABD2X0J0_9HYME
MAVYNQTGQSYIEQLALHRSMCVHMQRLIQAKSVVNARNPRYLQEVRRRSCSRPASSLRTHERACSNERCCSSSSAVEKMPCDDEGCDVIKVHCRNKSAPPRARGGSSSAGAATESKSRRSYSGERLLVPVTDNCAPKCPCTQQQQSNRSRGHNIAYLPKSNVKSRPKAEGGSSPTTSRYNEPQQQQQQQLRTKDFNYEKRHFNNDDCCKMDYTTGRSTAGSSKAWRQQQQQHQQKLCLCRKCSGGNGARRGRARRRQPDDRELVNEEQERTLRKLLEREEEESCYAKFVYDITQEIVQNGLYSDQELKQVFARHLERGMALQLDRRRMLYEIYQLKISLHMSDSEEGSKEAGLNEDEGEDEEELEEEDNGEVFAMKFDQRGSTVPKPPTPPRHLSDADDVVKKIESLRLSASLLRPTHDNNNAHGGRKSVTLVDANPELFVTEKDVLESLAENDVSPERIQSIYRNLFQRSKNLSPPPANEAAAVNSSEKNESRFKKLCRYCNVLSLFHNACERKDSSMSVVAPAGILRKECTDFDAKLSSDPRASSYYRYCYFKEKLDDAVEKCNRWKADQCHCMAGEDYEATTTATPTTRRKVTATSPPKIKEQQQQRMTSAKRKNSPAKTPLRQQQQQQQQQQQYPRSPTAATSTLKREKQPKQQQKQQKQQQRQQQQRRSASSTKKPEAAMMPKIFEKTRSVAFGSQPTNEQITSSPESSKRSPRVKETAKESKSPVPTPRTISSAEGEREPAKRIDTPSETNEEIEEDIDEEEQREKSMSPRRRSSSPKIHDKPDDETKEAASPSPRNIDNNKDNDDDDDDALSIASAGSSLNYDFSITSDLSINDRSPAKAKPPAATSAKKGEKSDKDVQTRGGNRRTARVQDFIKQFFSKKNNSKEAWKISESSSDTTDSGEVDSASAPWTKKATKRSSPLARGESINPERAIGSTGEAGLRIISNWKNDFSTNFYAKANASKYCDPGCRRGDEPNCSDNCKFVKTNCRNLSNYTRCLNKTKDENESESSD